LEKDRDWGFVQDWLLRFLQYGLLLEESTQTVEN
jgi:hypothetical protein